MDLLRQQFKQGEVYRRSDLEYFSTAIDRPLALLTTGGTLVKLNQGLYYALKQSKFGVVTPDDRQVVERSLKDEDFLMVSPNTFNSLGLGLHSFTIQHEYITKNEKANFNSTERHLNSN
jgi:hypothetical protein